MSSNNLSIYYGLKFYHLPEVVSLVAVCSECFSTLPNIKRIALKACEQKIYKICSKSSRVILSRDDGCNYHYVHVINIDILT